ncbi:MAG: protein-export chaperone SecB [Hyphomicrobium sp.]|nr:protein-export chaperone SecB [Hyphomicrobium sp.]
MAEQGNGNMEAANSEGEGRGIELQVIGQYIKDLSFENPHVGRLQMKDGENPTLNVEVNVEVERASQDVYESAIHLTANANYSGGKIYLLEVKYGGLFQIKNAPPQALEPLTLVNCPTLLFPFLRRIVADVTRDGGYPPLMLDPIDFGLLFLRRQQELAQRSEKQ